MAAAINLQLAGENYPGIRLVASKEAGCVAIGANNVFKIWKKDSEGKAIGAGIILLTSGVATIATESVQLHNAHLKKCQTHVYRMHISK